MDQFKSCCNKNCLETNPQSVNNFNKQKSRKDGLRAICKTCRKEYEKKLMLKFPHYFSRASHKTMLARKYDLSIDDYEKMLKEQDYKCAICNCIQADTKHRFGVDHDHKTGKIRSLLCYNCNYALGNIRDNYETAARLAQYLAKWSKDH